MTFRTDEEARTAVPSLLATIMNENRSDIDKYH